MLSKSTKFFLLLLLLGGVVWIGGGIARMVVGYSVFVPGTLEWNPALSDQARIQSVWLYTLLGGWTDWSWAAATVGGLGVIVSLRSQFRRHGWLLMSAILFVLILPVQAYVASEDYRLWMYFDRLTGLPLAEPGEIERIFLLRFSSTLVNVLVALSMLASITIIALGALQPLHNPNPQTSNES
ncbi:MAG: hypothetical protein FGM33_04520 [Candidatus Kapabacteria bacterium]|nr:hypothetical protein [Candidatus Kapabacteria bacterium]